MRLLRVPNYQRYSLLRQWYSRRQHSTHQSDGKLLLKSSDPIPPERIRNFGIIAHIDHGKSTLADRLLEQAGVIKKSAGNRQVLDKLQVERERGITVKAQLNLIDTPGHVDFSYEVSRSLAACQGILLLVDASQGIQAQTLANFYLAFSQNLSIIPVMNKIDLPHADPVRCEAAMRELLELPPIVNLSETSSEIVKISAKSGLNVEQILPEIIRRIPAPLGDPDGPLKALLFDSWYDEYRGVICLLAIKDGRLRKGDRIRSEQTKQIFEIQQVGLMQLEPRETDTLQAGQVGYIISSMKNAREALIGDTFSLASNPPVAPLPGFRPMKPMVFAGVYPVDGAEFDQLNDAVEKLVLNDRSVTVQKSSSTALGMGFRIGFLGMLHMDVFRQRLEEEFAASVIITNPSVPYRVNYSGAKGGTSNFKQQQMVTIENPNEFPYADPSVQFYEEPMIRVSMMFPEGCLGDVMKLCEQRRGLKGDLQYLTDDRIMMRYDLPLAEVAENHFFNELKHVSSGYASMDYEDGGYRQSDLVKLEVSLNGQMVDALSSVCHRTSATLKARQLVDKLREVVKRDLFEIRIQVLVNGKPAARETLKALRKDVTAKLYGGDVTRKMKLLDKQKEGKKRMKKIGQVELPHEAFLSIIKK